MFKKTVYFEEKDLAYWKNKSLLKRWKKEYPDSIQNHMFKILNSREKLSMFCFGELYTGIYYAKKGYKFLYEPWIENFLLTKAKMPELKKLQEQFINIFVSYAGQKMFDFIQKNIAKNINKGQPDLFVYKRGDFFFVEVKKEGDSLTKEQKIFIKKIGKISLKVKLVSVRKCSYLSSAYAKALS